MYDRTEMKRNETKRKTGLGTDSDFCSFFLWKVDFCIGLLYKHQLYWMEQWK